MYQSDNVIVTVPSMPNDRITHALIKTYMIWLNERSIKYSLVYNPSWNSVPTGINMRNEDALMFKLVFGL